MQGIYRLAVLGLALGMCGPAVLAQQDTVSPRHPVQVAFNYSYMRANAAPGQCGCFNMAGGSGEFAVQAWRGFSVVADLTGEFAAARTYLGSRWRWSSSLRAPGSLATPIAFTAMRRSHKVWSAGYTASTRLFPTTPALRTALPARWRPCWAAAWTSRSTATSQSGPSRPTTATRNCPIASTPIRISSAIPPASCCAPAEREQAPP